MPHVSHISKSVDAGFGLLDLIRYDSLNHPFVDRFGHLSLSFSGPATIGPEWLHPRSVVSTYQVLRPVLKLWSIRSDGRWSPARRTVLRSLPWAAEEQGVLDDLAISTRYVFEDETSVAIEMYVTNPTTSTADVRLAWTGAGVPDKKLYMLDYFDGASRLGRVLGGHPHSDGSGLTVSLNPPAGCDLPSVSVVVSGEPGVTARVSSSPAWSGTTAEADGTSYAFTSAALRLPPDATHRFAFRVAISIAARTTTNPSTPAAEIRSCEAIDRLVEDRQRFLLPRINAASRSEWLVQRARQSLLRCGLRGLGGEFRDNVASLCTSDSSDFSCSFFWDSLFSSVALAQIDPELARGAIRTSFVRQLARDGSTPERKFNHSVPQRMAQQSPQSPIATWAVNQFLSQFPGDNLGQELYDTLVSNHKFWFTYSDTDRDGLAEYRWTGQVSDNSPLWDFYGLTDGKPAGCQWVPPVASVALNSFLYRDALEIAHLAGQLGKQDEVRYWNHEAARIARNLNATCYDHADRRYWDFNHHTGTHRRVRTFWMFLPLWASVPVPQAVSRDLIENVLLDERQFFGPIPFPSVAYNEPTYTPTGYWRGKSWPHVSTWMIELLDREGYKSQAKRAAERLLSAWAEVGAASENLSTDPSNPSAGFLDYNWGSAAVVLLDRFLSTGSLFSGSTVLSRGAS